MKALLISTCLLVVLNVGSAHAALVSGNDGIYGAGALTLDAGTGLEWLDLTQSTNLSINDILAGAGSYIANGFHIATLSEVETLFTDGGWNGVDDSANTGSVGHLAFVTQMQSLFGVTGTSGTPGETLFNEGFALTNVANRVSRPFLTLSTDLAGAPAGRVACTTSGFNTFTNVNIFTGCRMDFIQKFTFVGTYLARPTERTVPEPTMVALLGLGLAGLSVVARRRIR